MGRAGIRRQGNGGITFWQHACMAYRGHHQESNRNNAQWSHNRIMHLGRQGMSGIFMGVSFFSKIVFFYSVEGGNGGFVQMGGGTGRKKGEKF